MKIISHNGGQDQNYDSEIYGSFPIINDKLQPY
jgi:hypothetical protein